MNEQRFEELKALIDADYHYQLPHIRALTAAIERHGSALDASDTGTGKTYTAAATASMLSRKLFVVCPIQVRPDWYEAARLMDVELVEAVNYEKLKTGKTDYLARHADDDEFLWSEWLIDPTEVLVVFDEVHKCKDYKTQNQKMALAAWQQGYSIIALSATAADNPMHMKFVAVLTGLIKRSGEFFGWMLENGVKKEPVYGYTSSGKPRGPRVLKFVGGDAVLKKIHAYIFPDHGSRMRIRDLGDKFPETRIIVQAYAMPDASVEIQRIYDDMREEIARLRKTESADKTANILVTKLRARQRVELLKVPAFVSMARDGMEEGCSVIVFVNFDATLIAIASRLGTGAVIRGNQTEEQRLAIRDAFNNCETPVVVCNIKAGGVGIGLHKPPKILSLISPTHSAIDLKQLFGRPHRAGGGFSIQKIIFCADTVEEETCNNVRPKLRRINIFNEGIDWEAIDAALDIE